MIKLAAVHKHYRHVHALKGIDLELNAGEVLGLFGHNGAGKTTTIKLILGLIQASSGAVQVMGKDPAEFPEIKRHIGFLPENVSFYGQLTGLEVLQYFARLKGLPASCAGDLLARFDLGHAMQRKVSTYSKGMRQRLGLAQALLGEPKLLLLDEPTVGLDPVATRQFYAHVADLKQQGCTLIICSHVLPGIEPYIDKALIVNQGRAVASGPLADLKRAAHLPVLIDVHAQNLPTDIPGLVSMQRHNRGARFSVQQAISKEALSFLSCLPDIESIECHLPSLDELYQHYMEASQ